MKRSEGEIRRKREAYAVQQRDYRNASQGIEAMACAIIVSILTRVLGEVSEPTIRVRNV